MSNSLVTLFKEQIEAECSTIAATHNLTDRGHFLIWWYFMRLHGFSASEVEEIFCDGAGDLGIDALWIDDDSLVHFYQFKHPMDPNDGIKGGDVDKVLSGLRLILSQRHQTVANAEVKARIEEIYQIVPNGYRLHFVSSGGGVPSDAKPKLAAFIDELSRPSQFLFQWDDLPLVQLQERFYQRSLPAVQDPIAFEIDQTPYMVRSAEADCYLFHAKGSFLASLYDQHGEGLLQRNIRVDQGATATNRSIEASCVGTDSANFLHYNNGVTFLCDMANYLPFKKQLVLERGQVVNGGQTIRALNRAANRSQLKADVLVPVRVITSNGNKDFGSNVAVNQNNQNQMGTGFLRSNDAPVIQLGHSLASLGWFLERRMGELESATATELAAIRHKIGRDIDGHVIRLKEGTQAYVATFYGQPELAKKNPKKMFLPADDGGSFDAIFSSDLTAEKMVIAHEVKEYVDDFVRQFMTKKRKKDRTNDWTEYEEVLGKDITAKFAGVIDQVMPQSALFLCGIIFKDFTVFQGKEAKQLPAHLKTCGTDLLREHLGFIMGFAKDNPKNASKSWPTLLKSMAFFNSIVAYTKGIREGSKKANGHPAT